jgi:hypothetical protein
MNAVRRQATLAVSGEVQCRFVNWKAAGSSQNRVVLSVLESDTLCDELGHLPTISLK